MTQPQDAPDDVLEAKQALREQLRARRRARTPQERAEVAESLAVAAREVPVLGVVLARAADDGPAPGGVPAVCVAAYASFGTEPGTAPLLRLLADAGARVLLPVIHDDGSLGWAPYADDLGPGTVSPGIPEPTGPEVGVGADGLVALGCAVVLVPALGVDHAGRRIGKAGGYYDRLLAGLERHGAGRPLTVAVVHDDDVVAAVPTQPHDRRVDGILMPSGYRRAESATGDG